MSRGQQTFRQGNVTKAVKGAVKAGIAVGRVEVTKDGTIVIIPATSENTAEREPEKNEWDEVLP
jgi:hypothetical protein